MHLFMYSIILQPVTCRCPPLAPKPCRALALPHPRASAMSSPNPYPMSNFEVSSTSCYNNHDSTMARRGRRRDEEQPFLPNNPTSSRQRRAERQQLMDQRLAQPQFTARAVMVGVAVGTVVCFSNMYFGLQSKLPLGS